MILSRNLYDELGGAVNCMNRKIQFYQSKGITKGEREREREKMREKIEADSK